MNWPPPLNSIDEVFRLLNLGEFNPKQVALAVQKMSDYYISEPDGQTPWDEKWACMAQIGYYLPLNMLRAQRVVDEGNRWGFFDSFQSIYDFGAGLGAGSTPIFWNEANPHRWRSLTFCERSSRATNLHRALLRLWAASVQDKVPQWTDNTRVVSAGAKDLLVMSYALTELKEWPRWAHSFGGLMIIEPSTREDGRRLMQLRKSLIEEGFKIWAPCTHQLDCPLLEKSEKDWCHDRVHVKAPAWFLAIEKELPFRNQTLTFSYLLASKQDPPARENDIARTVGDALEEKGKTRQLICRGPEREFLAWMHRDGERPTYPRGDLITLPGNLKPVSNELRVLK